MNNQIAQSHAEEVIAALWMICAILCAGFGFHFIGSLFFIKSCLDIFDAIKCAHEEIKQEREESKP